MPDTTLYLFDGYNLLHAGPYGDRRELVDVLASYVASQGARGIVVFDGVGTDVDLGSLAVRFAPDADTMLERLAAEHRRTTRVLLISSDTTVSATAGIQVKKLSSQTFFRDLELPVHRDEKPAGLTGRLDAETREKLEKLRRGQ